MEEQNFNTDNEKRDLVDADAAVDTSVIEASKTESTGTSVQKSDFEAALDASLADDDHNHAKPEDHNHAKPEGAGNPANHTSLGDVTVIRTLNAANIKADTSLRDNLGRRGDLMMPGSGKNTVIGSGDSDIIVGIGGGFNTITTGTGSDTIVLGAETTNRVFDFDPSKDKLAIYSDLDPNNIVIAQGKNPGKGGIDQPLDSVNNALVIDKSSGHILASLTFTQASAINDNAISKIDEAALASLDSVRFNVQEGSGKLTGTRRSDKLVGGAGDDFLYVGDNGFRIVNARGDGPGEFPFPNDSPGTTNLRADLKGGVLRINGNYRNFDGAPLFSQGETAIDEKAVILNGSDPQALINGFLQVPQDSEGNPISGTHLHFSPAGDSRGNFADATVERYLTNTPLNKKAGRISGEFELSPEEQAAFLAGNFYINLHTNVDIDKDGKGGFPTGENRVNLNQNVIKFA
ncbi:CHRD domain-containing protein [Thermocoleostomius sinensis]|uniref:CHRD domain-containing protein n=1 Tax=Thermocoleostomius sinensis A174 TaxID=2016057 RepID=A0A9E8ZAK7_9CYAN|nr:CHRD domain-containing protein [Thermocoleostomius sinensis]WAL59634.1 CHRD domain-containing protein [Thermocoleostomius sinensis A174]